jgi:hypothetical protein
MSNMIHFAEKEMNIIGLTEDDEMNGMMRKHILHMVKEFADEGHSGFSAPYALSILQKVLAYKPLSPLTGEDSEWNDVADHGRGDFLFQNNRYSAVFKEGKDGEAYDIDGKAFWDWYTDPKTGERTKSYYSCGESRTPVIFPYVVPETPIVEYRESE